MEIIEFRPCHLDAVLKIQKAAYKPLYEKYRDGETNPYLESRETVLQKYTKAGTRGYIFTVDDVPVGTVRVDFSAGGKGARISALAIHPRYQGRGIAQEALLKIEAIHSHIERWQLGTILQEAGNCHLYEKLDYWKTGEVKRINEKMSLVFYEKP